MSGRQTTDFFDRQDKARRNTGVLVVLFALAVLLLSAGTYIAMAFLLNPEAMDFLFEPQAQFYVDIELAVLSLVVTGAFIFIGSAWKTSALKQGGASVAQALGGKEVDASATDPLVRRYVNVVEEMALASGVPVPRIYVLENEPGINAFAAGFSMNDAAVAVTRGALEQLTRDELQGVVAHEFSHILNGDMRLNIRLIGVIHGILLIYLTGRILLRATTRGRSRGRGAAGLLAAGLVLLIFGLGGVLCGRLIKSAVSRQREYLADSAAVQFTRNPDGLAGALKKIGGFEHGSQLQADQAEEVSHMCFEKVSSRGAFSKMTGQLMATHPPIEERIKAIDPSFDPEMGFSKLDSGTKRAALGSEKKSDSGDKAMGLAGAGMAMAAGAAASGGGAAREREASKPGEVNIDVDADELLDTIGETSPKRLVYCKTLLEEIPEPLMEVRSNILGAEAVMYALLLDEDDKQREKQGEILKRFAEPGVVDETRRLWLAVVQLRPEYQLPLMDLLVPTLRRMSEQQYREFSVMVERLIQADEKLSFHQFILEKVVLHRLELAFHDADRKSVQHKRFNRVAGDIEMVLTCFAHVGHDDRQVAEKAFDEGRKRLPDSVQDKVKFLSDERWRFEDVGTAMERLSVASPKIKRAVIDACAYCVMGDGKVVVEEMQMLRATCEMLDVPLPPFIPEATSRAA